jgi:hypothetical protein
MAGNVVEFTDTITGAPAVLENPNDLPVYVKAHGGVANATDWQLWLTATGTTDPYGQQAGLTSTQGGARFGFLPDRAADRSLRGARHARASALARPPLSEGLVYLLRNQASGEVVRIDDLAEAVRLAQAPSSLQLLGASNPEIS